MSGSKTAIIVENSPPAKSRMDAINTIELLKTLKKGDGNKTAKNRNTTPVSFKLKLIEEVKKQDIIWQDLKEKKNPDLVENAWRKVRKVLRIHKVGYCEKQWKRLIHNYRGHLNRNTPMNADLVRKMDFMSSQLNKSSLGEQSDGEVIYPESPARNKAKTPKATKETKLNANSESKCSEDQKVSVAILKLLFESVPDDVMRPVRKSLVEVLIRLMPEIDTKILEHAKQEMATGVDNNKIDWSALDIPAEICKAVWDYKVMQAVFKV